MLFSAHACNCVFLRLTLSPAFPYLCVFSRMCYSRRGIQLALIRISIVHVLCETIVA